MNSKWLIEYNLVKPRFPIVLKLWSDIVRTYGYLKYLHGTKAIKRIEDALEAVITYRESILDEKKQRAGDRIKQVDQQFKVLTERNDEKVRALSESKFLLLFKISLYFF